MGGRPPSSLDDGGRRVQKSVPGEAPCARDGCERMDANIANFDFVLLTERPDARMTRAPESELSAAERTVRAVLDLMARVEGTLSFSPQRFLELARDRSSDWWKKRFAATERIGDVRFRERLSLALKIAGVYDVADHALRVSRIDELSPRRIALIERVLFCIDDSEDALYAMLVTYIRRNIDEIPDAVGLFGTGGA